ncbi:hypothetical protein VOLCADRAFT_90134 [Volvox carteri f. nagariensis]|uniref:BAH domain-containing protein n=1 Tax=Volvox carteri f. nagariensis TaxID=3068 RepID=D8TTK2_VOLCA|nr:uncharacterized protein VOLCADRAFT_90134 [Volvox carteri f. nagariensis]EFJ49213.1 hypothetical protein VOLCADRAFT_90134 [Volvox carteri f. nagariensis]|eukprot:XP_002949661.1 hypothetical protein VOLCADRAFT_90134 [Volvox carteri f. nagariensis]
MGKAKEPIMVDDSDNEDDNEGEDEDDSEDFTDELDIERDPSSGDITGVRLNNAYVDANRDIFVRRYSTVLVQGGEDEHKYLGYVRDLFQTARDLQVEICWFYRTSDLSTPPPETVVCRAQLKGQPRGGDTGRFKELFLSNHLDQISIRSVMHPIQVWLLPTMSLDPVTLPGEAAGAAEEAGRGTGGGGGGTAALLPGFVIRRLYNIQTKELYPLAEVPLRRKKLGGWLVDDVGGDTRNVGRGAAPSERGGAVGVHDRVAGEVP